MISRLTDVPLDDPSIDEAVQAIEGSLSEIAAFKFRDLFTNGASQNFRRASLAVVSQAVRPTSPSAFHPPTDANIIYPVPATHWMQPYYLLQCYALRRLVRPHTLTSPITYADPLPRPHRIGLSPFLSRVLSFANGLEYFLTAIVAIFLVDRLGCRVTMLGGEPSDMIQTFTWGHS